ncbi:MAG: hypothetical protein HeimC2_21690 [Candidatus Heimdallarchaeota archaeon LC_2]|nr:MAG: hypothetical protein HeimC2_21690 [Candidatus Heimdallarchaeota archaeon LC_2]
MNILNEDFRLREIIIPFQDIEVRFLINSTSIYISLNELSKIIDLKPKTIKFDISNDIDVYDPYLNIKNNLDLKITNNADEVKFLLNDKAINIQDEDIFLDEEGMNGFLYRSGHANGKLFAYEISEVLRDLRNQKVQISRDGHLKLITDYSDQSHTIKDCTNSIRHKIEYLEIQNLSFDKKFKKINKILDNQLINEEEKDMLLLKGQAIAKQISAIRNIPFSGTIIKLWGEFKRNFKLKKYSHLKKSDYEMALKWLKQYKYIKTNKNKYRSLDYDFNN